MPSNTIPINWKILLCGCNFFPPADDCVGPALMARVISLSTERYLSLTTAQVEISAGVCENVGV